MNKMNKLIATDALSIIRCYSPNTRVIECLEVIEKEHKVFDLLTKNLVVAFEEGNGIDSATFVIGVKLPKDKFCVVYETQNEEEIKLLKEVLL